MPGGNENSFINQYFSYASENDSTTNKVVQIVGINPNVDHNWSDIWDQGGLYLYLTSSIQVKVSSTSINDNSIGIGARTVLIFGLDSNYNEINESIVLNGQTEVLSQNSYLRIFNVYVFSAGSLNANVGDIYVGYGTVINGIPSNILAKARSTLNRSFNGFFTVPAGYKALYIDAAREISCGLIFNFRSLVRDNRSGSNVFLTGIDIITSEASVNNVTSLQVPGVFNEKNDIASIVRAEFGAGQFSYFFWFNIEEICIDKILNVLVYFLELIILQA